MNYYTIDIDIATEDKTLVARIAEAVEAALETADVSAVKGPWEIGVRSYRQLRPGEMRR